MKTLLIMLGVILFSGLNAQAADLQVQSCGDNLKQVQQIINDDYSSFGKNYASRFVGKWGWGLEIDMNSPFNYAGYKFKVCPQADGSFYIYQKDDSSTAGYLKLRGNKIVISGFKNMASAANGEYAKSSTSVATGNGSSSF